MQLELLALKRCGRCGQEKPLDEFAAKRPGSRTRYGYCLSCRRDYMRVYMRERTGVSRGECRECGGEVWGSGTRYCAGCKEVVDERRKAERRVMWAERSCVVCDSRFQPSTVNSRYCSSRCAQKVSALRKFGLSVGGWREMVRASDGRCASCGNDFGSQGHHIDHCHETGRVRGLLCHNCNLALGHTKDDPGRQFALSVYLARDTFDLRELCVR